MTVGGFLALLLNRTIPWSANEPTRRQPSMFSILENLGTVDEHVSNTSAVLMWLVKGRVVLNGPRIEDYNISIVIDLQRAAARQFQICRGQRGQAANALFEGDQLFFSN